MSTGAITCRIAPYGNCPWASTTKHTKLIHCQPCRPLWNIALHHWRYVAEVRFICCLIMVKCGRKWMLHIMINCLVWNDWKTAFSANYLTWECVWWRRKPQFPSNITHLVNFCFKSTQTEHWYIHGSKWGWENKFYFGGYDFIITLALHISHIVF